MDRQGFIDFNTRLSPKHSGKAASKRMQMKVYFQFAEREQARPEVKADSYARAISADAHIVCLSVALALHEYKTKEYYDQHFGCISEQKITMPIEPNCNFLEYHREKVFVGQH